ncbi:cysteine proteinase, partial [Trifolium medium]|nr:cysteine proteinase [Trifolium medium]
CSCAFATIATLEGLWQIRTGELKSLSVQYLVDCDLGSNGCKGGTFDSAFKFATTTHNGAIPSEYDYPFKRIQQTCNNDIIGAAGFDGYRFLYPGDEQQLLLAVAQQPVAVSIASGHYEFYHFRGDGIYSGPCGSNVSHGVAIVGYGESADGQKYWIIKNSWGVKWGDLGYMKLARGTGH